MTNKIIRAFSIAEVLVTMMVVALVVVMSAPVITRKKPMRTLESRAGSGNVF